MMFIMMYCEAYTRARVARVDVTLQPHPTPYRGRWGLGVTVYAVELP